jgi:hypothetical protein
MIKCNKGEVRRLKKALHWKNIPEKQRQRLRMVLLREEGLAQPAIASAMGVSLSTVIARTWLMNKAASKLPGRSRAADDSVRT